MDRTLRSNRAATHRFTVPCLTIMHHDLLDARWRRTRRPIKPLPFLSSRGNNDLYNDGATTAEEFSITMATWLSLQYYVIYTHTCVKMLSQYETEKRMFIKEKHFTDSKYFRLKLISIYFYASARCSVVKAQTCSSLLLLLTTYGIALQIFSNPLNTNLNLCAKWNA